MAAFEIRWRSSTRKDLRTLPKEETGAQRRIENPVILSAAKNL